jgi:hypothetical protein
MFFLLLTQSISGTGVMHASVVGPMTRAQYLSRYGSAPAIGNTNGYSNRLLATQAANQYNKNPGAATGAAQDPGILTNPSGNIPGSPTLSNPLGGINAIGDFFNRLTQPNTWIRVGEVAAGILLVYLGLSATMRGTEAQRAVQSVKHAGKKAVEIGAVAAK